MILINCIIFNWRLHPILFLLSSSRCVWVEETRTEPFPCSHNKGILGSAQVSNWDIPQETVAPSFIFFSSTNWTFCFFCTSKAKWYPCQWVIYGQLGCNDLVAILAVSCISYFLLIISLKQCYNPVCSWHWRDKSWWICGLLTSHICNVITLQRG